MKALAGRLTRFQESVEKLKYYEIFNGSSEVPKKEIVAKAILEKEGIEQFWKNISET